ncbi:uncharacterized protein LOC134649717 [Cydia amplana]|uniref:uncharacterized protein LOC134649717 n=1 Tax=Cydia amplana TaxID=1869771 RepID=UPI002FE5045F
MEADDDPGTPRSRGQDSYHNSERLYYDSPGAPRSQGQGSYNGSPGAPRSQGQGSYHDSPRAPRSQCPRSYYNSPGAPRSQGQGSCYNIPGAPRSQGQESYYNSPRSPRSQGRVMYYDIPPSPRSRSQPLYHNDPGADRSGYENDDYSYKRGRGSRRHHRSPPGRGSRRRRRSPSERGSRRHLRSPAERGSRRHPRSPAERVSRKRRRTSSEESGEHYDNYIKRPKLSKSNRKNRDSAVLDKFLDVLKEFKRSDKPKLSFNTNVVPEFDPMSKEQTVLNWLTKVEECASIYQWDDRELIHYALPKLTGVAKTWYQGLSSVLFTWPEWKKKLLDSFPCREDYAEILTEMLSKRAPYGESLEQYYYAKLNLLNRCKIYGRQAVDCILYGVDDRAVKVGAQAAQFSEPEQVLKYFRTVKVGQIRGKDIQDSSQKFRQNDYRNKSARPQTTKDTSKENPTHGEVCFNCSETGHRASKCKKPAATCTYCDKRNHLAEHYFKRLRESNDVKVEEARGKERKEKQVAAVQIGDTNNKYKMDIKVNSSIIECFVDLGSECSLITINAAKQLNLDIDTSEELPVLNTVGANLVSPVGIVTSSVEVQGIKEVIDLYVVENHVIKRPVLLGHSFTEKPDITIIKTSKELIFVKTANGKLHLKVSNQVSLPRNMLTPVTVESTSLVTGTVNINGSLRGAEEKKYYLLPGQYDINSGTSTLLLLNASSDEITLNSGFLLTRAEFKPAVDGGDTTYDCCGVTFDEKEVDESVNCGPSVNKEERLKLQQLLSKYGNCFSKGLDDLGFTKVSEMVIELEESTPVVYRPYRMSHAERTLVRNMVQEMLDSEIIRESSSPYASPIVLVQKKTGEKRLCVDYRALNRKTKKDHYPLPRVEDQLDQLSGNTLFTSLDLASGYYQIPISEESRHKTAFVTPDGQYEYNRMPFGLVNAPSVFQRTINKILSEAKVKYAIVYMDDILIPSKDVDEGLQRLEEVLNLLKEGGLTLKLNCNALRYTLTKRDVIPRVARWWVQIQEYDCSIEYRPGARMLHADALSRHPIDDGVQESHVLDVLLTTEVSDQDWISTVQSADTEIKKIKETLSDPDSEQVIDYLNNYKLKNDRVYRIVADEFKWVVPKSVRWQILQKNHDDVGHCGFDKTLQRIQKHYWFAKMRRFVKKYVASCLECAHHKKPGGKREGELHPIEKVSIPFHTIHADHLGPFVKSKKGHCYLLVIIDGFTKYANITPVKITKSATSIKVIREHISYFGVPTRLITDKGTSFTSKTFKEFVSSHGIKHIENAVATPRANGQVERFNRTILNALSTSTHGKDEKNWDEYVAEIQVGLNTTMHKTTQKTPSEFLFGFNVTSNSQGILNSVISDTLNVVSTEDLNDVREQAKQKINEQQNKDALRFNKSRKPGTTYMEGDLVRVERQVPHDGKSQKLVSKYQGPYRILKILPNDRYLIEDTPLTKKKGRRYENVVALDKIQPWLNFVRELDSDGDTECPSSDQEQ